MVWFYDVEPTMILKGCITYLGKPKRKKDIVYAKYYYCENCRS